MLIDPKRVELSLYRELERHYLASLPGEDAIITDMSKVVTVLNSLCIEMDNRLSLLEQAGARNIKEYNDKFIARKLNPEKHRFLPYIVLIIDEFADLIIRQGKEIENPVSRLAAVARAAGIPDHSNPASNGQRDHRWHKAQHSGTYSLPCDPGQ